MGRTTARFLDGAPFTQKAPSFVGGEAGAAMFDGEADSLRDQVIGSHFAAGDAGVEDVDTAATECHQEVDLAACCRPGDSTPPNRKWRFTCGFLR